MSVVRWVVVDSISPDGTAASTIQSARCASAIGCAWRAAPLGLRPRRGSGQRAPGDQQHQQDVAAAPQPALLRRAAAAARPAADRRSARRSCRGWRRRRADRDRRRRSSAYQRCISGACAETMKNSGPIEASRNHGTHRKALASGGGSAAIRPIGSVNAASANTPRWIVACWRGRDAAEPMGIGIAGEQQRLVDQHRAVPHRRRAAEPRQRHPRDHRLDQEQQERADEDRRDEPPAGRASPRPSKAIRLSPCPLGRSPPA